MPREQGRNPRRHYLTSGQTIEMCRHASDFIDAAFAASTTTTVENLKDIVFDDLVINMSWWPWDCVDYPGFCDYGGKTHGAWVCIRKWWSKEHDGKALRWDPADSPRLPGRENAVWSIIGSWDEALSVINTTIPDNASRTDNDMTAFASLSYAAGNRAVLLALQSALVFARMHVDLIEAATWFTDLIAAGPGTLNYPVWVREYDAIAAVERRVGFNNTATNDVGRELWAAYP